jgi:hypothetical protein
MSGGGCGCLRADGITWFGVSAIYPRITATAQILRNQLTVHEVLLIDFPHVGQKKKLPVSWNILPQLVLFHLCHESTSIHSQTSEGFTVCSGDCPVGN